MIPLATRLGDLVRRGHRLDALFSRLWPLSEKAQRFRQYVKGDYRTREGDTTGALLKNE